jgi:hypothetical protein
MQTEQAIRLPQTRHFYQKHVFVSTARCDISASGLSQHGAAWPADCPNSNIQNFPEPVEYILQKGDSLGRSPAGYFEQDSPEIGTTFHLLEGKVCIAVSAVSLGVVVAARSPYKYTLDHAAKTGLSRLIELNLHMEALRKSIIYR